MLECSSLGMRVIKVAFREGGHRVKPSKLFNYLPNFLFDHFPEFVEEGSGEAIWTRGFSFLQLLHCRIHLLETDWTEE